MTSGHVYCFCGRTRVCAVPNSVSEEQLRRNVKQQFTTPAFQLKKDQAEEDHTVLHLHNKQEAKPNTVFVLHPKRDPHPFSTDGMEMMCAERLK